MEFGQGCACCLLFDAGETGDHTKNNCFWVTMCQGSTSYSDYHYEVGEEVLVNHSLGERPTLEHAIVQFVLDENYITVC